MPLLPASRTVPVDGLWRLIVWESPVQSYSFRQITNWLLSRVPSPDGVSFEIGLEWGSLGGVDLLDDDEHLTPIALIPPTETGPRTTAEIEKLYGPEAVELGPYAIRRGITGMVRHEVERGDDRLRHLLDLGQRLVSAWSVEVAISEEPAEQDEPVVPSSCSACGLTFQDPWLRGTHFGQAHRYPVPPCEACGLKKCDSPLGRALHAGLVTKEEVMSVQS